MSRRGARRRESVDGVVDFRPWADLWRDLLVSVFQRLGVDDLIVGVPLVCSSWRSAAGDPSCWRNPDFRDWNTLQQRIVGSRRPNMALSNLINFCASRSGHSLHSLHLPDFTDEYDLLYVAGRCPELIYLSIGNQDITEDSLCNLIGNLEFLKGMAIYENLISHRVLLHISECCVCFCELKVLGDMVDEETASIICQCLPKLQKLVITDSFVSRRVLLIVLDNLKELEYLDISGTMTSGITGDVLEKASHLKTFKWSSKFDKGEFGYCSDCEQDYFLHRTCECMLDQQVMQSMSKQP